VAVARFGFVSPVFVTRAVYTAQQHQFATRRHRAPDYSELELKLNPELVYEGVIPYSGRIEYYLTVLPEKGAPSNVGSSTSPRSVESEDLPRVKEKQIGHHKVIFVVVVVSASVAVAVFALFGFHRRNGSPSNRRQRRAHSAAEDRVDGIDETLSFWVLR
jgi:hypothetical protein